MPSSNGSPMPGYESPPISPSTIYNPEAPRMIMGPNGEILMVQRFVPMGSQLLDIFQQLQTNATPQLHMEHVTELQERTQMTPPPQPVSTPLSQSQAVHPPLQPEQQKAPVEIDLTQESQESLIPASQESLIELVETHPAKEDVRELPQSKATIPTEEKVIELDLEEIFDDEPERHAPQPVTFSTPAGTFTQPSTPQLPTQPQATPSSTKSQIICIPSQDYDDDCCILYSSTQATASEIAFTDEQKTLPNTATSSLAHSAQSLEIDTLEMSEPIPTDATSSLPIVLDDEDDEFREIHPSNSTASHPSTSDASKKRKRTDELEPRALFSPSARSLSLNDSTLSSHSPNSPLMTALQYISQSSSYGQVSQELSQESLSASQRFAKRPRAEPSPAGVQSSCTRTEARSSPSNAFWFTQSIASSPLNITPKSSQETTSSSLERQVRSSQRTSTTTPHKTPSSTTTTTTTTPPARFETKIYSRPFIKRRQYSLSEDLLALLEKEFRQVNEDIIFAAQTRNIVQTNALEAQKESIKKKKYKHKPPLSVLYYSNHSVQWTDGTKGLQNFKPLRAEPEAYRTIDVIEDFWSFMERRLYDLGTTYVDNFDMSSYDFLDGCGVYMLLTSSANETWIYVGKTSRSIRQRLLRMDTNHDHKSVLTDPWLLDNKPQLIHLQTLDRQQRCYGLFLGKPKNDYAIDVFENLLILMAHEYAHLTEQTFQDKDDLVKMKNVHCTNIDIKNPQDFRDAFMITRHNDTIPVLLPNRYESLIVQRQDCFAKRNPKHNSLLIYPLKNRKFKRKEMGIPGHVWAFLKDGEEYIVGDLEVEQDYTDNARYPHAILVERVGIDGQPRKDWFYLDK